MKGTRTVIAPQPIRSIEERIRDEFAAVGGSMAKPSFAQHCIDKELWTAEELDAFSFKHVLSLVGGALRQHDKTGLPFAGKTTEKDEDGANVWKQRKLWGYPDYERNILPRQAQGETLIREAELLANECRMRFGRSPLDTAQAAD